MGGGVYPEVWVWEGWVEFKTYWIRKMILNKQKTEEPLIRLELKQNRRKEKEKL